MRSSAAVNLVVELGRPEKVRVPDFLDAWWRELGVNSVLANAPHVVWRVRGPGGANRFRAAIRSAVARHDILTKAVVRHDGAFYLERAPRWDIIELSSADVNKATAHDDGAQLDRTIFDLVWTPFAQVAGVFRPFVIELSATDAVCGFVVHHRVVDFYGSQILAREIRSEILGPVTQAARDDRARLQYSEFLQGMADWVTGPEAARRLEYWRECMRDAPPSCLPGAANVDSAAVGPMHYAHFEIAATVRTQLVSVARACRSTLSLVTMAANHLALAAESDQRDIVAKVIVSGRDAPSLLDMVGYTADCIPLRAAIVPGATFAGFVREIQQKFSLASRHRVKQELVEQAMKAVGGSPIAPVFNFHAAGLESKAGASAGDARQPDLSLESLDIERAAQLGSVSFNRVYGLTLIDTGKTVPGHVQYMPMRHDRGTVEAFIDRFSRCLAAIGSDPFAPVERVLEN